MAILHKKGNLSGAIGNIVTRTFNSQTVVQSKPKKFKPTPASQESALEFGLACATACSIRNTLSASCPVGDSRMVNRLNTTVLKAIRGSNEQRGIRDLHDADLSHLKGFQFNTDSALTDVVSIRPESSMPAPDQIKINIPSFTLQAKKGPRETWAYRLRLLVTAFHFKEEWSQFIGHEDIDIHSNIPFEGKEWLFKDLPVGCVITVTISLHAFSLNSLRERVELNNRQWSPAEIIGAYHILDENGETLVSSRLERHIPTETTDRLDYTGNDLFERFQKLWQIHGKPEKPMPLPPAKPLDLNLPKGRMKLKQRL